MKKLICIIQARTGSTRFPGKVLKKILGRPILSFVIERAALSEDYGKEQIVIATTDKRDDDAIVNMARDEGVGVFRGSETDVLDRYYQAASAASADVVLRITSDCPLIDPQIIDSVTKTLLENDGVDYCSNRLEPSFPEGLDTEVFTFNALERAWKESRDAYDREHVTPYIYKNRAFIKENIRYFTDLSYLHLSVDYEKDFLFVKTIFEKLRLQKRQFLLTDIIDLLSREPEILKINQGEDAFRRFTDFARLQKR